MLKEILPEVIWNSISLLNMELLQEIRLRVGKPIIVRIGGVNQFLSLSGATDNESGALIARKSNIVEILNKCSNNSLYTINDEIINGYISVYGGIRIGVCGEIVSDGNKIQTQKNITSLNIRVPHEIKNCSLQVFNLLVTNGQVKNTLIISSPGMGKTTFIRDLAYQISNKLVHTNTLIVDERGEITGISGGVYAFDTINADVYVNCSKLYGFTNGIRSMRPDVIITDEISLEKDLSVIENAMTSGVKVIATIHASDINELRSKKSFLSILQSKLFERFVVLNDDNGVGTIAGVYNSNLSCIYV